MFIPSFVSIKPGLPEFVYYLYFDNIAVWVMDRTSEPCPCIPFSGQPMVHSPIYKSISDPPYLIQNIFKNDPVP